MAAPGYKQWRSFSIVLKKAQKSPESKLTSQSKPVAKNLPIKKPMIAAILNEETNFPNLTKNSPISLGENNSLFDNSIRRANLSVQDEEHTPFDTYYSYGEKLTIFSFPLS